jgi:hypothetical protein
LLAYVLWHVARAGVAARDYESAHQAFHDLLWESGVAGLAGLRVHALPVIPWLASQAPGYEDWHLLEDSAALDRLNEAAITKARQLPHDRIAALADEGIAGLYGLRAGSLIEPAVAYWLSKPAGMRYAEFDRSLAPLVERGCCLWGRRMTLGPTPEFCLHAPGEITLPHPARAIGVVVRYRRGAG